MWTLFPVISWPATTLNFLLSLDLVLRRCLSSSRRSLAICRRRGPVSVLSRGSAKYFLPYQGYLGLWSSVSRKYFLSDMSCSCPWQHQTRTDQNVWCLLRSYDSSKYYSVLWPVLHASDQDPSNNRKHKSMQCNNNSEDWRKICR